MMEVADVTKTHDCRRRDLVFNLTHAAPPEDLYPLQFREGQAEKYNQPVLDKLLAGGVIVACGLAIEEVCMTGDFTHFTWYDMKDLSQMDKIRAAFIADRNHRAREEQDTIATLFTSLTDPDAARNDVTHAVICKVAPMK